MHSKKILGLFFVLLLLTPFTSRAEVALGDGKFAVGGNLRFRYEFKNDTDFGVSPAGDTNDTRDFVLTRFRPFFKFLPDPKLTLLFEPQFSGGWGERDNTEAALTPTGASAASTSGTLNDPALGIHQAFMEYQVSDRFSLKVGRQELLYGDQLVIGPVGWHNIGRSFDGAKTRWKGEKFWLDAFWSLLDDAEASLARPNGAISGEAHLGGLYSSIDLGNYLKELDFYALYRLDRTGGRPIAHNYVTLGTRLKSSPAPWDYRLELTGQLGKQQGFDQRDYQLDVEGGYTWQDLAQLRAGIEGFVASLNYNQLFPTAHAWLGYLDLFGRRNIMGGVFHLSLKPTEKVKLNLDAHTFFRTKTSTGLSSTAVASGARVAAGAGIGGAGSSTSRLAGEEFDLMASYQAMKFLNVTGGFSAFMPLGFIKSNVDNEWPLFGWIQTTATF